MASCSFAKYEEYVYDVNLASYCLNTISTESQCKSELFKIYRVPEKARSFYTVEIPFLQFFFFIFLVGTQLYLFYSGRRKSLVTFRILRKCIEHALVFLTKLLENIQTDLILNQEKIIYDLLIKGLLTPAIVMPHTPPSRTVCIVKYSILGYR